MKKDKIDDVCNVQLSNSLNILERKKWEKRNYFDGFLNFNIQLIK